MSEYEQLIITITDITTSEANGRYKIETDANGSFSFFKIKKDNTETKAYQTYRDMMGLNKGDTVRIAYTENKIGKYTYKNILKFDVTSKNSVQKAEPETPTAKPRDFEAEAFGKCKHAFLLEAYIKDKELTNAEIEAEEWATASMRNNRPIMDDKEEQSHTSNETKINVEDIPF